jgi:hypothetical protein
MPGLDRFQAPTDQAEDKGQSVGPAFPDQSELTPEERATVAIFERNTPSVVNIANLAAYSRKCAEILSLHLSPHLHIFFVCVYVRVKALQAWMCHWMLLCHGAGHHISICIVAALTQWTSR